MSAAGQEHVQSRRIDADATPAEAVAGWPEDQPIAALISSGGDPARSRWSIVARPTGVITTWSEARRWIRRAGAFDRATPRELSEAPPFSPGLIGWLGYELGGVFEERARSTASGADDDRGWPEACLHECSGAYVFDHACNSWWAVGDVSEFPALRRHASSPGAQVGEIRSGLSRDEYIALVNRAIEYIRAGDVYQVNVARRLTAPLEGSHRAVFGAMVKAAAPWYGALIEGPTPGRAALSISPELFLQADGRTGLVLTRPIKGTSRRGGDVSELSRSEKDRAELTMIVDLMRNDLGRVCAFGSVRVVDAQAIERHGGVGAHGASAVHHGVATIEGRLREDADLVDLIEASFPAGSITGAPKIRAMQIIDELEPAERGPYCGSVGWIGVDGSCALNVAIRTASVVGAPESGLWSRTRGVIDYGVGAGIVADSDAGCEWDETEAKAAGFRSAIRAFQSVAEGAAL